MAGTATGLPNSKSFWSCPMVQSTSSQPASARLMAGAALKLRAGPLRLRRALWRLRTGAHLISNTNFKDESDMLLAKARLRLRRSRLSAMVQSYRDVEGINAPKPPGNCVNPRQSDHVMNMRQDIHNSETPVLCRSCEARHRGVCGALNPQQLIALAKQTTRRVVDPGTQLAANSVDAANFANILSGVVKLTKSLADGRQQIVGLQFAPDFLGRPFKAESFVDSEAATKVGICSFPKSMISRLIKESPELEHRILQQTLNELDEARDWMLTLGRKTAAEKVASFLYLVASHIDPENITIEGPATFDLPLTRADIADFLGLTIETVSRQFTKLSKDGVIEIEHNRKIRVTEMGRLRRCARI
jgi:CRP/FNR family transcriptional regulator, anaerobic regulatory protein